MTQATVSRDIRELGLEKLADPLGRLRYTAPSRDRRADPRETLRSLLAQFGRGAIAAQNVVVVQSEIGSAPAIARALDRLSIRSSSARSQATTRCLVIAADARRAAELAAELRE